MAIYFFLLALKNALPQVPIIVLDGESFVDFRVLNTNFWWLNYGIGSNAAASGSWPAVSQDVTQAAQSWPAVSQDVTQAAQSWPAVSAAVTQAAQSWPLVSNAVTQGAASWPLVSNQVWAAAVSWDQDAPYVIAQAEAWGIVSNAVTQNAASWPAVSGAVTAAANSFPAFTNTVSGPGVVPVGAVMQWIASNAPSGWLLCAGQGAHTNTYSNLFAVIGFQYGGSGTNFLLPDMRGRVPLGMGAGPGRTARNLNATGGVETVTLTVDQLASHNHAVAWRQQAYAPSGWTLGATDTGYWSGTETGHRGGNQPHDNMPPFIVLNYIIKY